VPDRGSSKPAPALRKRQLLSARLYCPAAKALAALTTYVVDRTG
jgi:hypothetical protein